jgi:hypothetical protein
MGNVSNMDGLANIILSCEVSYLPLKYLVLPLGAQIDLGQCYEKMGVLFGEMEKDVPVYG